MLSISQGRMRASVKEFLQAFTVSWFVAMSGEIAVPLTIIGCLASSIWIKAALLLTGVFCALFSVFSI